MATKGAVAIRRQLAQATPPVFLPGLAISLTNLGLHLSALGRREEALAATQEAVRTLLLFFRALYATPTDWTQPILQNYLCACRDAGQEPDARLVKEVQRLLRERRRGPLDWLAVTLI